MLAGIAKIDITPVDPVWMEGMIRTHKSEGIHDPIFARALVLANSNDPGDAFVIVSVDICLLSEQDTTAIRTAVSAQTGIPAEQMIVAATHTHSGPTTSGLLCPAQADYSASVVEKVTTVISDAYQKLQPAALAYGAGKEETISHYRRLLADDGHVVMNWEPFPMERIIRPLGVPDTEVGVLKIVDAENPANVLGVLFNHAGHPNVLSGENYLISADYPGVTTQRLDQTVGGISIFVNGAQGTMDIDGLRDRDWEGLARVGNALAAAVEETVATLTPRQDLVVRGNSVRYPLPARKITDEEFAWAQDVLAQTGGEIAAQADGVGDDYKADLYLKLRAVQDQDIPNEQVGITVGDSAWISVPSELYTEIGMKIKEQSPFRYTYLIGLANGYIGYIPTRIAIQEGGYAEDTRRTDAAAEDIVIEQSLALLHSLYQNPA